MLPFSYFLDQGGSEFNFQSKSYDKWTIFYDIDELALDNFCNIRRNRPNTRFSDVLKFTKSPSRERQI